MTGAWRGARRRVEPRRRRAAAPLLLSQPEAAGGFRHIYCVSDLHTDYELNLEWVKSAAPDAHADSVLLVAGDVSDRIGVFETTMAALAEAFGLVFFVPGNHDLWVRRDGSEGADSLQKLRRLERICESLGVLTTPQRVRMASGGAISICPMLSFHHTSFDTEPDVPYLRLPSARVTVTDFRATRWPSGLKLGEEALAAHLDTWNDALPDRAAQQAATLAARRRALVEPIRAWAHARDGADAVLSFSHFLPRIELIPEKRFLVYPDLIKAVGSNPLGRRVARLRPDVHCFGHSHFGWDATLDGVRYVQAPLATPEERQRRPASLQVGEDFALPMRLYDGDAGGFAKPLPCLWSDHYKSTARTPHDTFPAPWVVKHYTTRAPARITLSPGGFPPEILLRNESSALA